MHNKGRLQELFLGSCTNAVLHHCTVPLVVVPPAWRPQLEPQGPTGGVAASSSPSSSVAVSSWGVVLRWQAALPPAAEPT